MQRLSRLLKIGISFEDELSYGESLKVEHRVLAGMALCCTDQQPGEVTPLIRPIVTNRPPTASASRQGAKTSPPILSTIVSTPSSPGLRGAGGYQF
jgi:hypothetical protein